METAINIFWDSKAQKKDNVYILGMGSVGILTAYYFKLQKYKNVHICDINFKKKKYAKLLDLKFINFYNIKKADVIINTTSNYDIITESFKKLNIEGKFVEASWYGSKKGRISLGGFFHSRRLKIISSQVSKIPKYLENKHDYATRLNLAIKALSSNKLLNLITGQNSFMDLEKKYISILDNPNTIMHCVKYD